MTGTLETNNSPLMKAIICKKYGQYHLELREVEKPVPKENEVLIKVKAVSLNTADHHIVTGTGRFFGFGLLRPKHIPGSDVSGVIEAVGSKVSQFLKGDEVYGDLSGCGWGGLAEYVCAPESVLAAKPSNISFEEAAAVPMAAVTALQGLRKAQVRSGQKVLIHGASGGVGTFAVQLAKAFRAEVTAVCSSDNVERVAILGADHVINYHEENFVEGGHRYDLVLAVNGNNTISDYKKVLTPWGNCVVLGGGGAQVIQALFLGSFGSKNGKKIAGLMGKPNCEDLIFLKGLIEERKVKPVIDRRYTLSATRQAFEYLHEGHAKGKIVLTL